MDRADGARVAVQLIYPRDDDLQPFGSIPSLSNLSLRSSGFASPRMLTRGRRLQICYEAAVVRVRREGSLWLRSLKAACAVRALQGLEYLHRRGIPHRDIKLRNILLDDREPQTVKLADFGLSGFKKIDISGGGTDRYAAPEVNEGSTADKRSDMFSFGVVMFEVACAAAEASRAGSARPPPACGQVMFNRKPKAVPPAVQEIDVPEDCPAELAGLLKQCLSYNPNDRPSVSAITAVLERLTHQFNLATEVCATVFALPPHLSRSCGA